MSSDKRQLSEELRHIRLEAERRANERIAQYRDMDEAALKEFLQELQTHQVELEIQNEELRQAQHSLELARRRYVDLYDSAPVGYASLDDAGVVLRANETFCVLLGLPSNAIVKRPLTDFIDPADRGVFISRFKAFAHKPADKIIDVHFRRRIAGRRQVSFVGRIQGRRLAGDETEGHKPVRWEESLLVVISDVSELKRTEEQIQYQAFHDSLTGLPNRANLYDRLETALSLARRHHRYGALLFMDMDRFKNINDSLGHQAGDELLVQFSERIIERIRREDLLVRMGGDEFVVLLSEQVDDPQKLATDARRVADKLIGALSEPFVLSGHAVHITVSAGISIYPLQPDDDVHDVIRQADTAMYQAKSEGRNLIRIFQSGMEEQARKRLVLEADLRRAIDEKQFEMVYQPQVLPDGTIQAVEALLRWRHPSRGFIAPGEFVSVTEETGLIIPLGQWILEDVLQQAAIWQEQGLCRPGMDVAINISVRQLLVEDFVDRVEALLNQYQTEVSCVVFEITESLLLPSDQKCQVTLARLSRLGITFSVDDFGTGYSSLAELHHAPIQQLKIDRRFVQNLEEVDSDLLDHQSGTVMARTIIRMAQELGMQVVAEGVETEIQRGILETLGCDYLQGYLFSRPISAEAMTALLEQRQIQTT